MSYPAISTKKLLGLMVSVEAEGDLIAGALKPSPKRLDTLPEVRSGTINNVPVAYSVSGLGKTNAAHCLTLLILNHSPALIIIFGVGGAYPSSGLLPGDIAVASKEVYADEGVLLKDGLHPLQLTGIPLLKTGGRNYFNEFPLDRALAGKMVRAARSSGLKAAMGVFATVSACTGTRRRAQQLPARTGAICENMEGAAAAHICRRYGLPVVEVRGISNVVETRDISRWDIATASENCQRTVLEFLKELGSR